MLSELKIKNHLNYQIIYQAISISTEDSQPKYIIQELKEVGKDHTSPKLWKNLSSR